MKYKIEINSGDDRQPYSIIITEEQFFVIDNFANVEYTSEFDKVYIINKLRLKVTPILIDTDEPIIIDQQTISDIKKILARQDFFMCQKMKAKVTEHGIEKIVE